MVRNNGHCCGFITWECHVSFVVFHRLISFRRTQFIFSDFFPLINNIFKIDSNTLAATKKRSYKKTIWHKTKRFRFPLAFNQCKNTARLWNLPYCVSHSIRQKNLIKKLWWTIAHTILNVLFQWANFSLQWQLAHWLHRIFSMSELLIYLFDQTLANMIIKDSHSLGNLNTDIDAFFCE